METNSLLIYSMIKHYEGIGPATHAMVVMLVLLFNCFRIT